MIIFSFYLYFLKSKCWKMFLSCTFSHPLFYLHTLIPQIFSFYTFKHKHLWDISLFFGHTGWIWLQIFLVLLNSSTAAAGAVKREYSIFFNDFSASKSHRLFEWSTRIWLICKFMSKKKKNLVPFEPSAQPN